MAITLRIPGLRDLSASTLTRGGPLGTDTAPKTDLFDDIEVVDAFSLSPIARGKGAAEPTDISADENDVLEIEVDGFILWTSAQRYKESLRTFRPDAIQPDAIRGEVVIVDALPGPDVADRGYPGLRASAVRLLRVGKSRLVAELANPDVLIDFAKDFGFELGQKAGGWATAKALTWLIERQLRPREGLYTWAQAIDLPPQGAPDPTPTTFGSFDTSQPILLFLHGTGSSTRGSFGGFIGPGGEELVKFFKQHIYAFEHKTLSRSPIENAILVASALPAGAQLYLISHSRGGLIGDLLSLSEIPTQQIAAFTRHRGYAEADAYDQDGLRQLSTLLQQKQFRVQRFARVACPARGTLLASENLDQFLSVLAYLIGLIPGLESPLYEVVKRVALEAVHERWEPERLPGLEAMTPASPLVRLLNSSASTASGSLGVVAGDIEGGNWLKRFGVFISDRFIYENRDNDLVVNTNSMFEGVARDKARYIYDRGADVSHFNYFKNARTRARVSQWMTSRDASTVADFRDLAEAKIEPVPLERSAERSANTTQPVVFLVPDFMGSDLYVNNTRIWLSYDALRGGDFGRLANVHDPTITTRSVLGEHYGALFTHLAQTHLVLPFPYDWRQSIVRVADELHERIDATLREDLPRPVRIVAHGMGGLVVRQLAQAHADTWNALCASEHARIIFLGVPHQGTYESVEMMLGTHPIVQQVALLDRERGIPGIVEIVQDFPSVAELLPISQTLDFFNAETWRAVSEARRGAKLPNQQLLDAAKTTRAALDAIPSHRDRICNVAGTAPRTVRGIDPSGRPVTLDVTSDGDGRVTHASADLAGGITWYMNAGHGGLVANADGFAATVDLLQRGDTRQLPMTRPSASRGGETTHPTLPEKVLYPTAKDLLVGAFGYAPPSSMRGAEPAGFSVSVVHGDLFFAKFPIVVGHYEGDTIIGAEAVVNRLLDDALRTRYNLGLYPGPVGTISVVLREQTPLQRALQLPNGAIVVGLGRWGDLTAGQIANLVRRCALEYVLQLDDAAGADDAAAGSPVIGLSILLIGATSASNISIDDSVAAILRGIAQANKELDERVEHTSKRITEIEIIELFSDAAIEAARSAKRLARSLSDELHIRIEAAPLLKRGRQGRVRLAASRSFDAWRRWEITSHTPDAPSETTFPEPLRQWLDESIAKGTVAPEVIKALASRSLQSKETRQPSRLKFVSLSERARAEVMLEQHQPGFIDDLIRSSITKTQFNSVSARALFELMVPNDLKDGLGLISRVVFVLDGDTSRYPWELMTDAADRPLCTRIGMVRQLQSPRYRSSIRTTTGKTGYVVADPLVSPPFRQLPGARREGQMVAELLIKGDFTPTLPPDPPTAIAVLGGLLAQPYRIVHLAGHGHYEDTDKVGGFGRSGMVLDHGFLTAAELHKMTQVPELVFMNCCFIGQTGPGVPSSARDVEYNRLAASVSRELIEMGVRAVVAAGWAVRDDAALAFAQAFYEAMLSGATFGRALQDARNRTWRQFPDVNTWGAYQAYGDPDFKLISRREDTPPMEQVATEELLEEIASIGRRAQNYAQGKKATDNVAPIQKREDELVAQLDAVVGGTRAEWLNRSDVRMALGEAYGDLEQFEKAATHFTDALATGELDSKTTLKAVEQLSNFEARYGKAQKRPAVIREAIKRLESLQRIAQTSERYSLLGSAYKRLADLEGNPNTLHQLLTESATAYEKAHKLNEARGAFEHYPVLNFLALRAVLGMIQPNDPDAMALLSQSESRACERFAQSRDAVDAIFDAVAPADVAVVRAIINDTFATNGAARNAALDHIVDLYRRVFHRVQPTRRQQQSAMGQLDTLANLIGMLRGNTLTKDVLTRDALAEIRRRVDA
jgi:tetratricopeptide (TPR) repeat protein